MGRILAGMIGNEVYSKYTAACKKIRAVMNSLKKKLAKRIKDL